MNEFCRNGLWPRVFCVFLVFAAGCTTGDSIPGARETQIEQEATPAPSKVKGTEKQAPTQDNKQVTSDEGQETTEPSEKSEPFWLKTVKEDFA
jgi:hypothetical protein